MMKKLFTIILSVAVSFIANGQFRFGDEAVKADMDRMSSCFCPYPDTATYQTPPPEGYKPFHIIHVGRHGSRYLSSEGNYTRVLKPLLKAESLGVLTEEGRKVLSDVKRIAADAEGQYGKLLPRGEEEHRHIIQRMCTNFPEVFARGAGKCRVDVMNTMVSRVRRSRDAGMAMLKECVPGIVIDIHESDSLSEMYFKHVLGKQNKNELDSLTKDFSGVLEPSRFMAQLFSDARFMNNDEQCRLMAEMWMLAAEARLADYEDIDLRALFSTDEAFAIWKQMSYFTYCAQGPHPQRSRNSSLDMLPLMERFIACADSAAGMYGGKDFPVAHFHYCHDSQVIPLSQVIGFENCTRPAPDMASIASFYCDFNACPMGGNIQFVMFNKQGSNDVFVKVLHHEREARLAHLHTDCWPYYHWSELRPYLESRIEHVRTGCDVSPVDLRCNGRVNPLAVDNVNFSWKLASYASAAGQSSYELWVGSTPDCTGDVWKSGKVDSDRQAGIVLPESVSQSEGSRYFWKVRVWDKSGNLSEWSPAASFSAGISHSWKAAWIMTGQQSGEPLPYIRKTFKANRSKVERAVVYLSGLGCSELFFNGKAVDPGRILDPAQTDYGKRALYSAFDVTELLSDKGRNCVGVMLGDGWFNQDKVWDGGMTYGKPRLSCQIIVEYENGRRDVFGTDTSWKWAPGPLVSSNVYKGDEYDARLEISGWSEPDFNDAAWKRMLPAEGVIPERMQAQEIPPMRAGEPVKPVKMWKSSRGENVWVYDFGRNMTAEVLFCASLPRGAKLMTRASEEVDADGEADFRSTGIEHVGYQQDSYTFAGRGVETWMPVFTYHGFRYLELTVEGTDRIPSESWLSAVPVHTDVETTGSFSCSDDQINTLHQLAVNTFLNAFVGVPVDCNQREKCGWLGDVHAYDRAADMNFDMNVFWTKYLEDIRTTSDVHLESTLFHKLYNSTFYFAEKKSGIPFMIAPGKRLCGVASPDWGTVVVQLPWHLYLYCGNRAVLDEFYDMMSGWTRHVDGLAMDGIVFEGLGDWCPMAGNSSHNPTPVEFTSTAFHFHDLDIMASVAEITGHEDDAAWFASRREYTRRAMERRLFNPLKKSYGSQTADAMALEFGLIPDSLRETVASGIIWDISHNTGKFLNTGVFGLCRIASSLSRNGRAAEALEIFARKGDNSFGYMTDTLKVTTLWESLPFSKDRLSHINGSHCHPMQGGYDLWMYEDIAGIKPLPADPGFRTVVFEPLLMEQLEWASGSIESPYGTVSSSWKHDGGRIVWNIEIPAGSRGLVALPQTDVRVNGSAADDSDLPLEAANGRNYTVIPSGVYVIEF